jgi:hypothetical protein
MFIPVGLTSPKNRRSRRQSQSNVNTGFQTINSAIGTLSNELRNNSKTQWPVIWSAAGVWFVVLSGLGVPLPWFSTRSDNRAHDAFFYGTLSKTEDRPDTATSKVTESVVPSERPLPPTPRPRGKQNPAQPGSPV